MGNTCCKVEEAPLTEELRAARREERAAAAEARAKTFKQGGGGEKLKAKAKALEEAEKNNKANSGGVGLKWTV